MNPAGEGPVAQPGQSYATSPEDAGWQARWVWVAGSLLGSRVEDRGIGGTEGKWASFTSSVGGLSERRQENEGSSLPSSRDTAFIFSDPTLQFSG